MADWRPRGGQGPQTYSREGDLIDRANHHLFQPLLYQAATSVLTPAQIASPIRSILRTQRNITVLLGEVTGVNSAARCILFKDADRENVCLHYDYLILATGAGQSYFGHDEFRQHAPGHTAPLRST
jgi:NADH dehydrogenase